MTTAAMPSICAHHDRHSHPVMVTCCSDGAAQVHDIEDLVAEGKRRKACPYFASRHFAEEAELVFCPYK